MTPPDSPELAGTPRAAGALRELVDRRFTFALFAVHFYFSAYFVSVVNVPASLEGEPAWVVGAVVGSLGIAGMATRPLVGVLVDSGNRQRWLRAGGVATAIAFAGYAATADLSPWLMVVFRMLHGAAMGLYTTAQLAMVTSVMPARSRGLGMGVYQSSNAVSQLYAAVAAVWLASVTSLEFVFLVGAAVSGVALLFGMNVTDVTRLSPPASRPWRQRQWISPTALAPALVFLTMTTTMGAVLAFLPLFAVERDLGNVGLFYTAYAVSLLPMRALSGALSDRVGRARVVLPALVAGALALFLLSSTHSQAMLLAVAVLYGLAFGAVQVVAVALVADRTPHESLGAAMATYTMAWDVGAVLGGVLLGVFIEATSYAAGFALCGLFPLAGVLLYLARVRGRGQESAAASGTVAGDTPSG